DGTTYTNIERFTNATTGSGNDIINLSQRIDNSFNTGSGDDTINTGLGSDGVDGGAGNDVLIVDYSSNTYTGTSPQAGIYSNVYNNGNGGFDGTYFAYYNTSGYDQVSFSNIERFQITATSANDNIVTGDGNDTINSGAGNDSITARSGNDSINTEDGNDSINAGDGNDTIDAGNGDDVITGGAGINVIDGGAGIDTIIDGNLSSATTAITIDESNTTKNFTLADGTTYTNIERFTNATTGSGNDIINLSQRIDNS
ncbi:MAG: hypothetical protein AN487_22755, partial [Anabaena sp. CRKS33]